MTLAAFAKIVVVAFSLALDVFAVSVGVGIKGMPRAAKLRIGAAFATSEVGMTLVGVGLGKLAGALFGDVAGYLGFGALVAVGAYMIYEALAEVEGGGLDLTHGWGLFVGALSISLDSLGIGFSILYIGVPLAISITCIAIASVVSTSAGLALGKRLGAIAEEYAGLAAGVVLVATGVTFAALKALGVGS